MKGRPLLFSSQADMSTSAHRKKHIQRWLVFSIASLFILGAICTAMLGPGSTQAAHAKSLPAPWADGDIGSVGIAGSASYTNKVFSVTGSSIIEYNYDKFHYVYQPLYGDGTIVARVTGLSGGTSAAKAGIMIRDNLGGWPAAVNAYVQINATKNITFQRRLTAGDVTNYTQLSGTFAFPYWLKLVRSGATITAFAAPDGRHWTQVGSDTLSNLTVDAWVGMAVASGSDSSTSTATFDNVSVTQPTVNVGVDWTNAKGTLARTAYGLNGYSALNPSVLSNSNYTSAISSVNAGLMRLHYGGLLGDDSKDSSAWVNTSTQSWDAAHIKTILDGVNNWNTSKGYKPTLLINIPGFPSWLSTYSVTDPNNGNAVVTDNLLATDQYTAYANFCAQLVKIVNIDQQRGVKYFEVPNESDNNYNQRILDYNRANGTSFPTKMDELATLYNQVVVAMKAVDPSIQVGGPAFQRPDAIAGVTTFINDTINQTNPTTLDFLSMHGYASGSASDSDFSIYNRVYNPASNTGTMSDNMIAVRKALDTASPSKHIPLLFDEYNISWTWTTQDVRMKNYKGVVFDALSMAYFLGNGADSLDAWNDADGIYGKIDPGSAPAYQLRPGGQFLKLMNAHGVGSRVASTTSVENTIVPLAVKATDGYTYVLINRSPNARQVNTSFTGGPAVSGSFTLNQFSSTGLTTKSVTGISKLTLPPFSVTIIVTP